MKLLSNEWKKTRILPYFYLRKEKGRFHLLINTKQQTKIHLRMIHLLLVEYSELKKSGKSSRERKHYLKMMVFGKWRKS